MEGRIHDLGRTTAMLKLSHDLLRGITWVGIRGNTEGLRRPHINMSLSSKLNVEIIVTVDTISKELDIGLQLVDWELMNSWG